MQLWRGYVDKKIIDGLGGEHSRVVDVEADTAAQAEKLIRAQLEDDEDLTNQVVGIVLE
jgi:hypothetical protein